MMTYVIQPLDRSTLAATSQLVDGVFPHQRWWETARWALALSLQPNFVARPLLAFVGIRWCRYWTAVDDDGAVIGVSGFYRRLFETDAAWVGWTCVDPRARGGGIGKQLIERDVDETRSLGLPRLKLYTTDLPEQAAAVRL